jgi:GTP-binding protein
VVGTKEDLLLAPVAGPPGDVNLSVSGLRGDGIPELRAKLDELVRAARAEEPPPSPFLVLRPGRDPFVVRKEGTRYRVSGPRVERWVAETDLEDPHQVSTLQRRLVRAGVERRLGEAGAHRGDEVMIGDSTFEYIPKEADADQG